MVTTMDITMEAMMPANTDITVLRRCTICRDKWPIEDIEKHMYAHYNYCKYGHYEEFEVGDPRWPECMNERDDLFPREEEQV